MKSLLLFQNLGVWEILIIAFIVLLLFGGKKIPELMHGIGKGVKSFKKGMNEVEEEINKAAEDSDKDNYQK
ncbi:MAG: twin-arginine translocase TatA/TatE family subunit [Bacteroidales bacterium]|nr:twin-arginine translocase TatA/TatE family subunit [Bacteroidales bacterium]